MADNRWMWEVTGRGSWVSVLGGLEAAEEGRDGGGCDDILEEI